MEWYVLYTTARAEKHVELKLQAEGVETYLPLHKCPRKWSDRVKMVEMPLFSSYIFVNTTDEKLRTLIRVSGVARIVYYNGKPAVMRPKEIEAIREFVQKAAERECEFGLSEEVLVACGPLKDISGKIKKIGRKYLILHIEQMGITVCVKQNQVIRKESALK
ncbi:MAG: UpxY family transcription antiterminator [Paludibacter sp.]|nr:UpxY family transcription antiterminator [Paludibacter sp.]